MSDVFDWDIANRSHIAQHGITSDDVEQLLVNNPLELDPEYVNGEWRFSAVGLTRPGRWLVVITTLRSGKIRVVTSFDAPKSLIALYLRRKGIII